MRRSSVSISVSSLLSLLLVLQTPTIILVQSNSTNVYLLDCPSSSGNYPFGSQFESNLKNFLIPTLVSNASPRGYFNTSSGTNQDTVYGLVQCRVDVSLEDCQSCLRMARVRLLTKCPQGKDATVRYNNCLLRYSNIRFYSKLNTDDFYKPPSWFSHYAINISDVDVFNKKLEVLFNNLTSMASSKQSKFMTGSIKYNEHSRKIHGLVDCTQDLSNNDCSTCLQAMFSQGCCKGKKSGWVVSRSCEIQYHDFQFFKLLSPPPSAPLPLPLPPSTAAAASSPTKTTGVGAPSSASPRIGVIIGASLAGVIAVLLLVVVIVLCVCYSKRKRIDQKDKYSEPGIMGEEDIRSAESLQFQFAAIRMATNNFSEHNKLGEGGFGEVYKGELPYGQEIAVKRLSKNSRQGLQEFKNEVVLLHKLQHRNLVRLLGFCLEGEEKILIYEYVPNRSLDKHLFAPTISAHLDWEKRYKIIGGIARGLLYLHEDSRLRIIHRDLKAANILLDGEMNAKIADFGVAKLFVVNQTQGNTSIIGGTFGYIAPEYALHGLFSVKSDVFSFGVLVLEIISGQRTTSFHKSHPQQNLLSYAWKQWREGTGLAMLDSTLRDNFSEMEVRKSLNIGLLCVQENIESRPTITVVVSMLNSNSATMTSPSQPAFSGGSDIYSNIGKGEQESNLYKQQTLKPNLSIANSSTSDYTNTSGIEFPKTIPR